MKTVLAYPSAALDIKCPGCSSIWKTKGERPLGKDFKVCCPKCKEKFIVNLNIRKANRKNVAINVVFFMSNINNPSDKNTQKGKIVDFSQTGCLLETNLDKNLLERYFGEDKGDMLTLLFSLSPKNEQLKVKGRIMRFAKSPKKKKIKIGIELTGLKKDQAKKIGLLLL